VGRVAVICGETTHSSEEQAMVSRLNPYIGFTDNARQAMEFYQEVFGGTLVLNTFGEYGTEGEDADKIMHGQLDTDQGYTLMGADTPTGMQRDTGSNITISLSGDEGGDLRGYWEKLSEGGTISIPLEKQMWGDEFGQCTDRFGVNWMINIGQPQS
jgi:PhnB protein